MEPNKLEQDIQQKLQGRSIQPSAGAWDRLDAMLTIAEQQAAPKEEKIVPVKKNNRNWLYMAAAFLLMLGGGFFLMNQEAEQNVINTTTAPQVVHSEAGTSDVNTTEVAEIVKATPETLTDKGTGIKRAAFAQNKADKNTVTTQPVPKQEIAQNIETVNNTPVTETPQVQKRKLRVDPEALLASVEGSQPKPGLAAINQPKVKVNANNLLDNVEGELDNSFRNKVLNSLEKNYNVVKTAVTTRNLQ